MRKESNVEERRGEDEDEERRGEERRGDETKRNKASQAIIRCTRQLARPISVRFTS